MNSDFSYTPTARFRVRDDVMIGPPLLSGRSTVYYLKDRATGWFYRMGEKEVFIISRMDGTRTLAEISEDYYERFSRKLNAASWQSLIALLEQRQLLAHTFSAAGLAERRQMLISRKSQGNRGFLRRRLALFNPDRLLDSLLVYLRFIFQPMVVLPTMMIIMASAVVMFGRWESIAATIWEGRSSYSVWIAAFLFFWLITAVHELAHGLSCKHYGGSVEEIGFIWRYLMILPYCKIDDIMLCPQRRQRVYASFAGIFANLIFLPPLLLLWHFAPSDAVARFSALSMLFISGMAIVNLIPFVELDGYFILNHALGFDNLRQEANTFWREVATRLILRRGPGASGYHHSVRRVYVIYGLLSIVFTTFFLILMALYWIRLFYGWSGAPVAWGILLFFIALFSLVRIGFFTKLQVILSAKRGHSPTPAPAAQKEK